MRTTAQPGRANVIVRESHGLGNQQPRPKNWVRFNDQDNSVGSKRTRNAWCPIKGKDMICSTLKGVEGKWNRLTCNTQELQRISCYWLHTCVNVREIVSLTS
jgi:hypothetical protein